MAYENIICFYSLKLTLYSARNSCSIRLSRRSSHESSNAVKSGSREERAISEGAVRAR